MRSFIRFILKILALLSFLAILAIGYVLYMSYTDFSFAFTVSGYNISLFLMDGNIGIVLAAIMAVHTLSMILIKKSAKKYIPEHDYDGTVTEDENTTLPIEEADEEKPLFADDVQTSSEVNDILLAKEIHNFLSKPKEVVEMDLISAARDAMESLTPFAEAQKIKLHLSTACETITMMSDPESIRILFRNIIDNSIKYMGRPGHMIITISLLGDDIFLILKDTGKGLSEDETTHVFELNYQGSNRVSGNGLGLTQTKMIVEAFGGTIYAKSSPGNGMAIYIQLPVSGQKNE